MASLLPKYSVLPVPTELPRKSSSGLLNKRFDTPQLKHDYSQGVVAEISPDLPTQISAPYFTMDHDENTVRASPSSGHFYSGQPKNLVSGRGDRIAGKCPPSRGDSGSQMGSPGQDDTTVPSSKNSQTISINSIHERLSQQSYLSTGTGSSGGRNSGHVNRVSVENRISEQTRQSIQSSISGSSGEQKRISRGEQQVKITGQSTKNTDLVATNSGEYRPSNEYRSSKGVIPSPIGLSGTVIPKFNAATFPKVGIPGPQAPSQSRNTLPGCTGSLGFSSGGLHFQQTPQQTPLLQQGTNSIISHSSSVVSESSVIPRIWTKSSAIPTAQNSIGGMAQPSIFNGNRPNSLMSPLETPIMNSTRLVTRPMPMTSMVGTMSVMNPPQLQASPPSSAELSGGKPAMPDRSSGIANRSNSISESPEEDWDRRNSATNHEHPKSLTRTSKQQSVHYSTQSVATGSTTVSPIEDDNSTSLAVSSSNTGTANDDYTNVRIPKLIPEEGALSNCEEGITDEHMPQSQQKESIPDPISIMDITPDISSDVDLNRNDESLVQGKNWESINKRLSEEEFKSPEMQQALISQDGERTSNSYLESKYDRFVRVSPEIEEEIQKRMETPQISTPVMLTPEMSTGGSGGTGSVAEPRESVRKTQSPPADLASQRSSNKIQRSSARQSDKPKWVSNTTVVSNDKPPPLQRQRSSTEDGRNFLFQPAGSLSGFGIIPRKGSFDSNANKLENNLANSRSPVDIMASRTSRSPVEISRPSINERRGLSSRSGSRQAELGARNSNNSNEARNSANETLERGASECLKGAASEGLKRWSNEVRPTSMELRKSFFAARTSGQSSIMTRNSAQSRISGQSAKSAKDSAAVLIARDSTAAGRDSTSAAQESAQSVKKVSTQSNLIKDDNDMNLLANPDLLDPLTGEIDITFRDRRLSRRSRNLSAGSAGSTGSFEKGTKGTTGGFNPSAGGTASPRAFQRVQKVVAGSVAFLDSEKKKKKKIPWKFTTPIDDLLMNDAGVVGNGLGGGKPQTGNQEVFGLSSTYDANESPSGGDGDHHGHSGLLCNDHRAILGELKDVSNAEGVLQGPKRTTPTLVKPGSELLVPPTVAPPTIRSPILSSTTGEMNHVVNSAAYSGTLNATPNFQNNSGIAQNGRGPPITTGLANMRFHLVSSNNRKENVRTLNFASGRRSPFPKAYNAPGFGGNGLATPVPAVGIMSSPREYGNGKNGRQPTPRGGQPTSRQATPRQITPRGPRQPTPRVTPRTTGAITPRTTGAITPRTGAGTTGGNANFPNSNGVLFDTGNSGTTPRMGNKGLTPRGVTTRETTRDNNRKATNGPTATAKAACDTCTLQNRNAARIGSYQVHNNESTLREDSQPASKWDLHKSKMLHFPHIEVSSTQKEVTDVIVQTSKYHLTLTNGRQELVIKPRQK